MLPKCLAMPLTAMTGVPVPAAALFGTTPSVLKLMHSSPVRKPFATLQVSPTMSSVFPELLVGIDVGTTMTKATVVGLFEFGVYLRGHNAPGTVLAMHARLIGFVIGIVLMVVIPMLAGAPMRFF